MMNYRPEIRAKLELLKKLRAKHFVESSPAIRCIKTSINELSASQRFSNQLARAAQATAAIVIAILITGCASTNPVSDDFEPVETEQMQLSTARGEEILEDWAPAKPTTAENIEIMLERIKTLKSDLRTAQIDLYNATIEMVEINTADSEELQTLPGIGPATAEKILAYKAENGLFVKKEDIINVSGIGPKTLEKFIDIIYVDTTLTASDNTA